MLVNRVALRGGGGHTRTLAVWCYFVLKLVIRCSLYYYVCPQTCALKVQLQDHNHLNKCSIFLILLNLSAESPTNPRICLGKTRDLRKLLMFVRGMKGKNVLLEWNF